MSQLNNPLFRALTMLFVGLLMVTAACNSKGADQNAVATSAAQTVAAEFARQTETAKAAPTNTSPPPPPAPVEVVSTEAVPPPQVQPPTEAAPPVSTAPSVTGTDDVNCRMGPDPIYPRLGSLFKGQQSNIIGVNDNGSWWLIADPRNEGQNCWVWGGAVQVSGDTSAVPYIPSPPIPDIPDIIPTEEPIVPFSPN